MKRFHACCPSHATSRVANRILRSLALGSVGCFGLLFKIYDVTPARVYFVFWRSFVPRPPAIYRLNVQVRHWQFLPPGTAHRCLSFECILWLIVGRFARHGVSSVWRWWHFGNTAEFIHGNVPLQFYGRGDVLGKAKVFTIAIFLGHSQMTSWNDSHVRPCVNFHIFHLTA